MKVTVIVRTYNRPEFLKQALTSIQLQTHKDWEVIIFDDGATDINFDVYKKFKSNNNLNELIIASILKEVVNGLVYLHSQGHIHRFTYFIIQTIKLNNSLLKNRL
jgi:GT2 family glycosyltransferase